MNYPQYQIGDILACMNTNNKDILFLVKITNISDNVLTTIIIKTIKPAYNQYLHNSLYFTLSNNYNLRQLTPLEKIKYL